MKKLHVDGVAEVLEGVRTEAAKKMLQRICGCSLSENEIAKIAGDIAREASGNGIAQAYQLGVNRCAVQEEMDRPTVVACPRCGHR